MAIVLELIEVTICEKSINPVANPDLVYIHSNTRQIVSEEFGVSTALNSHSYHMKIHMCVYIYIYRKGANDCPVQ
jgi:hypothetical protein